MDNVDEVLEAFHIGFIVAAFVLKTGRVPAAIKLFKECLILLKSKALEGERELLASIHECIYLQMFNGYVLMKDCRNAMECGRDLLVLARRNGKKDMDQKVTYELAEMHLFLGKYQEAKEFYLKALSIMIETDDQKGLLSCYHNLGSVLLSLGEFVEAKECHQKALAIAKESGDKYGECACYGSLGNVYKSQSEHVVAKDYYENALKVLKTFDDMEMDALIYGNLGNVLQSLGDYAKAIENHEKALKIAKKIGDKEKEAWCHRNLGSLFRSTGKHGQAVEYNEKAVAIAKESSDRNGVALAYLNLGILSQSPGKYLKAEEYLQKALVIIKEMGSRNKESEALCYVNLGTVCHFLGTYAKSKEHSEKALNIAKVVGDKKMESLSYGNLGTVFESLGEYFKSKKYLKKALSISQDLGDRQEEGRHCGNLAVTFQSLGENDKAKEYLGRALKIRKEVGDRKGEASSYLNLGEVSRSVGKYGEAKEHFKKALMITKEIGDRENEAFCYGNLGTVLVHLGEFAKAYKYHKKALEIRSEIGHRQGEASDYANLGIVFQFQGRYTEAKKYIEKALEICMEIGDRKGEAIGFGNVGRFFLSLGEYTKAQEYYSKALTIATDINHREVEAASCGHLGAVYRRLGEYTKAKEYHEKALKISKETGDKRAEAWCYKQMGRVFECLGEYAIAQENHETSLAMSKQIGDRIGEASSYGNLGIVFQFQGEYAKAKEYHEKALLMSSEAEDIENEIDACGNLAMIMLLEGNVNEATSFLLAGIHKFERILNFMTDADDQLKISLFDKHVHAYQYLSLLFSCTQNPDRALYTVELGRARALADLMSVQYSLPKQISHDPQTWMGIESIMENERKCICLYISYAFHLILLWIMKSDEPIRLRTIDVNTCFVDKVFVRYVDEIFGTEIVRQFHNLSPEKCEDRSWFSSNTKEDSLAAARLAEEDEDKNQQPIPTLSECYNMIIAPVAEFLDEAEIIIVPDRYVFKVPFAALQDENGKYLSESFRIRIIPSLTTLKLIHDSPADYHSQTGVLIVGDPDVGEVLYNGDVYKPPRLPFAEMEAEMIAQLLGAKSLVGKQATKQAVLQSISSFSLVHFAAHGNAERGEIALAPSPASKTPPEEKDYLLTIRDISKVRIQAKLVVLSCCHSARGQIKAEGAVGIARAFLGSGARSVLVALWAIEDKATKHFMSRFYEHLVLGVSASESLQEAMKWMRANGFPDMGQWAPFMLIGDNVSFDFRN